MSPRCQVAVLLLLGCDVFVWVPHPQLGVHNRVVREGWHAAGLGVQPVARLVALIEQRHTGTILKRALAAAAIQLPPQFAC